MYDSPSLHSESEDRLNFTNEDRAQASTSEFLLELGGPSMSAVAMLAAAGMAEQQAQCSSRIMFQSLHQQHKRIVSFNLPLEL